jgi:hypothetical protein
LSFRSEAEEPASVFALAVAVAVAFDFVFAFASFWLSSFAKRPLLHFLKKILQKTLKIRMSSPKAT